MRKFPLILAPTPLHPIARVGEELGLGLWIKRDDLTGFAGGGNKGRKLEFLLAEAMDQGAEALVACGSLQSNFLRQLAAACAVAGLEMAAATMDSPYEDAPLASPGLRPEGGNVLLDEIFGADLRLHPDGPWESLYDLAEDLAQEYEAKGKRVYRIPIGGSAPLGAYAFYEAGQELAAQGPSFDWIVFASSSGSTHVGLRYWLEETGSSTRLLGIACDPEPEIAKDFAELGCGLAGLLKRPELGPEAFELNFDYVGPGYGAPSEAGQAAIRELARKEGILLDPIYSGKAFAGLLDLARRKQISGRVLFWHTGGTPALFAMPEDSI